MLRVALNRASSSAALSRGVFSRFAAVRTFATDESSFHNDFKAVNRASESASINDYQDKLAQQVKDDKIVLYMKGTADQPMCGFSGTVVRVLKLHGVPFRTYNVLADSVLREAVKKFSDWPTIPQLYIDGEFVGGCDIIVKMHQAGELKEALENAGFESQA